MTRRPPKAHGLRDMWPYFAVVRCDEGDTETFMRLATAEMRRQGMDFHGRPIAPPIWQWFRINPCGGNCREHAWHVDEYDNGGRGCWRGSYVQLGAAADEAEVRS